MADHCNIEFSVEIVRTKLRSIKPEKASGPDGIHTYLLRKLASSLCYPLSILFTKSLEEMNGHYTWKEGHITSQEGQQRGTCQPNIALGEMHGILY